MKISVIIPTYRRPDNLVRAVSAMAAQQRRADEVLIVVRYDDLATQAVLPQIRNLLDLTVVRVQRAGVIAALNRGREESNGDIIAFTDDDAAPHSDWLARIEQYFLADEGLAGVGGRDLVRIPDQSIIPATERTVGCVQWFGRVIGNHHIGMGESRYVDVLKGVNMSYRQTAIKTLPFDERFRGNGAQAHYELMLCLKLRAAGWKLIFDPQLLVDHFPAQRHDEDQRDQFNEEALENAVHNETLALLDYLPTYRRLLFGFWAIVVGTCAAPGLLQGVRLRLQGHTNAWAKTRSALRGRKAAYQVWRKS